MTSGAVEFFSSPQAWPTRHAVHDALQLVATPTTPLPSTDRWPSIRRHSQVPGLGARVPYGTLLLLAGVALGRGSKTNGTHAFPQRRHERTTRLPDLIWGVLAIERPTQALNACPNRPV